MMGRKELRKTAYAVADAVNTILGENTELKATIKEQAAAIERVRGLRRWAVNQETGLTLKGYPLYPDKTGSWISLLL